MAKERPTGASDGAPGAETRPPQQNTDGEPTTAPAAAPVVMKTPEVWAKELGFIRERDPKFPHQRTFNKPGYAEADALFCWTRAKHHLQKPGEQFVLSREDFEQAVKVAPEHPLEPLPAGAIPPATVFLDDPTRYRDLINHTPRARSEESAQ